MRRAHSRVTRKTSARNFAPSLTATAAPTITGTAAAGSVAGRDASTHARTGEMLGVAAVLTEILETFRNRVGDSRGMRSCLPSLRQSGSKEELRRRRAAAIRQARRYQH